MPSDHAGGLYGATALVIMSAPRNHMIKKDLWSFFTFSFTLLPHLKRATHLTVWPNLARLMMCILYHNLCQKSIAIAKNT